MTLLNTTFNITGSSIGNYGDCSPIYNAYVTLYNQIQLNQQSLNLFYTPKLLIVSSIFIGLSIFIIYKKGTIRQLLITLLGSLFFMFSALLSSTSNYINIIPMSICSIIGWVLVGLEIADYIKNNK